MKIIILFMIIINCSYAATANRGRNFNPAIGINGLFLYQNGSSEHEGFSVQGLEMMFTSDVDTRFRAEVLLGLHPSHEEGQHGMAFDAEEAYLETTGIKGVTFKFGKFKTKIGKHNEKHAHNFPFVDAPLVFKEIVGHEGYQDIGVSASFLLPYISWFSEATIQIVEGELEANDLFNEDTHEVAGVFHLTNLWDLSEDLTFEWGVSGLSSASILYGTDLTVKWRKSSERSFEWSTEFLQKDVDGEKLGGLSSFIKYQLTKPIFVQYRYDYLGFSNSMSKNGHAFLVGYMPSEFSGIRLQYQDLAEDEKVVSLQLNFSIGAHPAHSY